tara:strand:- start:741 stop:1733 length:993 start_codon:yes stop_codon:yes gene_type:complete
MHKCVNNTIGNVYHLEQMVDNFFPYSQKQLGFDRPATIVFQSDEDNAGRMLGKTAYYNPETFEVVLYTDNRHPKDVMRSLSHELVHHAQNCRGDFDTAGPTKKGYAQSDPHLRKMEREAYTKGNLIFRDFEDLIKTGKINIEIDFSDSGEPKMSLKEWKNNEINTKLMKKWGLLTESKEEVTTEGECPEHGAGCGCPGVAEGIKYRKDDDWGKSPAAFTGTEKEEEEAIDDLKHGQALEEDSGEDEAWNDWKNEHADDDHIREIRHHLRALEEDRDHDRRDAEYDHDDYEDDRKDESVTPTTTAATGKISVKEAKEITRKIIERIKKEVR